MSHLFSYGCIAGIKQRAEMLQARRGVQQGSRAKEGPGVSDSIAKQVVKRFLSFSVCDENITFRASWFGHAAYTAVGYQFVTVSHFSPSTNTPSLYSQLCFTAQKSILWRILLLGLKAHLWVITGSQLGMEWVWNENITICSTEGLQGS